MYWRILRWIAGWLGSILGLLGDVSLGSQLDLFVCRGFCA